LHLFSFYFACKKNQFSLPIRKLIYINISLIQFFNDRTNWKNKDFFFSSKYKDLIFKDKCRFWLKNVSFFRILHTCLYMWHNVIIITRGYDHQRPRFLFVLVWHPRTIRVRSRAIKYNVTLWILFDSEIINRKSIENIFYCY